MLYIYVYTHNARKFNNGFYTPPFLLVLYTASRPGDSGVPLAAGQDCILKHFDRCIPAADWTSM